MTQRRKQQDKRARRSFERTHRTLNLRQKVNIVAEGASEQNYLSALRETRWKETLTLRFDPPRVTKGSKAGASKGRGKGTQRTNRTDVKYLINCARKLASEEPDVPVWIVCDGDLHSDELERSLDKVRNNTDVSAAISNPSIEFWFLCCHGRAPQVYNGAEAVKQLCKVAKYEKPHIPDKAMDPTDNAKKLATKNLDGAITVKQGWPPIGTSTLPFMIEVLDALAGINDNT